MQRWPVLLFLAWACFLFFSGIGLFTSGFLLMRIELTNRSSCSDPLAAPAWAGQGVTSRACWMPQRVPKAVLLIIDALTFEFARFDPAKARPRPYENKLGFLHQLAGSQPRHARLYRFRADPPTTTMQRIKGITTGSLPTFIDVGSNFASYAIEEDNLLGQLVENGRRVVFMGDDTWDGLFPQKFFRSYFFPSFNVKDLHTVDDGILQHLYTTVDGGEWDLLIAHFLGVDHCGHKHGPDHPEMAKKLTQMNEMLRSLVDHLANDTLLVVAGDHGMTETGDHGGDSEKEVNAALFVYSKTPLFGAHLPEEPETIPQVNLVPTLALLLGVPIPYSNIGEVMAELFSGDGGTALAAFSQLSAYRINAGQVDRFLHSYSLAAQDLPAERLRYLRELFSAALEEHDRLLAQVREGLPASPEQEARLGRLVVRFQHYLREARAVCMESWARFHPLRMVAGCALIAASCLLCCVASELAAALDFSYRSRLLYPLLWGLAVAAVLGLAHLLTREGLDLILVVSWSAATSQLAFFWHSWGRRPRRAHLAGVQPPVANVGLWQRLRAWQGLVLPMGILFIRCCAMFSDSFVVAEARVAPFLLASLAVLLVGKLHWHGRLTAPEAPKQSPGAAFYQKESWQLLCLLAVLLACLRLSGLFHQCREEIPHCQPSPFLAPLSSLQSAQAKNLFYLLCVASLAGLVYAVRCWLQHYGNLNSASPLVLFVRWAFPLLAVWIACYWAVTSGAEDTLGKLQELVQVALVGFPQAVYGLASLGLLLVLWTPVTVFVKDSRESVGPIVTPYQGAPSSQADLQHVIPQIYRRMQESLKTQLDRGHRRATVAAYGLGSVYSAALVIVLTLLGLLLLTLHSERMSLAFLLLFLEGFVLLQIHAWVVSLAGDAEPFVVPWYAVTAWVFAATQFFYSTGHQPIFPAIHWHAAFVGFQEGHSTHLLPAVLVGANTFASHILFAVGCPLLLLWPFVCEVPNSQRRKLKKELREELQEKEEQPIMEMRLRESPERFSAALLQLGLKYLFVLGVQLLACVLAAMVLRRHLMVWKVFAPKFLFEALGFMVSSICLLLGIFLVMRVDCAVSAWFEQLQPR
ncbi:GPI ethanolamine phosphate transferase 3 isoform X1 [Gopherus evgoodei]|uniref:GPI ethanolamine phosphate transferase 3, catalytic subunit n=2 Tax=Gopherus evgoodei TaxID=1825980 RepID=A0A8C4WGI6_9SAUR|nr:GPI ethanolamine phosphate transferase 3 isoform X1 [Gopherus evgoodei]XP_030423188.1 GPI ethanolamine phosphate transferase 3 isoform X1 [Gopherus evgoodei]